ncbi:SOS response UmuD protein [Fodinibius salinus]|uniref:SOS response UmuD protein n=1 Tax=Fodinibius salinus TaxID=860790 RepID=A0A5D3YFU0_9BACT|nr:translesion error-prone DNA polymerase V autoproteolytic subunit [Fodinibius salinus]TYP92543.1 SOS response UmuD protein [Fodinibius salinus]
MENFSITDIYSGNIDRNNENDPNRFRRETGFPSPAQDHYERRLSLDDYIIRHPAATFFMRVKGNGLNDIGIYSKDILVIDRSLKPTANCLITAILEGEIVVRKLIKTNGTTYLAKGKDLKEQTEITEALDFKIWGVVSHSIHEHS